MAALRDLASNLAVRESIRPAVHSASINGESVDLRGFNSALVAITAGAVAGAGNVTPKLQDSDNGSDWADVTAANLQGEFPAALVADTAYKVGYLGSKRYVRAVGTLNSGTSVAFAAVIVLGNANLKPVA